VAEHPVVPTSGALRPLGLDSVELGSGFWGDRRELNAAIIDHCLFWARRMGWVDNFTVAPERRRGREFADSEVYKLLEAMAWNGGHPAYEELAAAVASAQHDDGYLNTRWPGSRYSDLEWGHELYCYGHLIQAAVARLRRHGDDTLVRAARRAADHVCARFAEAGVCGHPEIETALVELYRATGEERYLEQARRFVERRGGPALADIALGRSYFQDDIPVRRAGVFGGHAVRALYLACGVVDVAVETGDRELLEAVIAQWDRTVAARTYLTGGMGSRHTGEAFGEDFELPPDRAYSETCAGVASVMLAWRLLLATGDVRYADLAERTLYNVIATSPAIDGRSFFYANPLHQRVPGHHPDTGEASIRAYGALRAPWFNVSCCPNNIARTFASLPGYVATTDDGGVQLHLLTACDVRAELGDGRTAALSVETGYPRTGAVTVRVDRAAGGRWEITVRVPSWAEGATLTYDGHAEDVTGLAGGRAETVAPGTVSVTADWRPGDELRLDLPMAPRWTRPDPRIDAVRGCVALERGPVVYCAESVGEPLGDVVVDTTAAPEETSVLGEIALTGVAHPMRTGSGWPYGSASGGTTAERAPVTFVPYHLWGNRGPAAMRVWMPER
jgi:uncharacterized protein